MEDKLCEALAARLDPEIAARQRAAEIIRRNRRLFADDLPPHYQKTQAAALQKLNLRANCPTLGFTDVLLITPNVAELKLLSGSAN